MVRKRHLTVDKLYIQWFYMKSKGKIIVITAIYNVINYTRAMQSINKVSLKECWMFNPIMGNLILKIFSFAKKLLRFIDCHRVNFVERIFFVFQKENIHG